LAPFHQINITCQTTREIAAEHHLSLTMSGFGSGAEPALRGAKASPRIHGWLRFVIRSPQTGHRYQGNLQGKWASLANSILFSCQIHCNSNRLRVNSLACWNREYFRQEQGIEFAEQGMSSWSRTLSSVLCERPVA
jgi:hypothetical protein